MWKKNKSSTQWSISYTYVKCYSEYFFAQIFVFEKKVLLNTCVFCDSRIIMSRKIEECIKYLCLSRKALSVHFFQSRLLEFFLIYYIKIYHMIWFVVSLIFHHVYIRQKSKIQLYLWKVTHTCDEWQV